MITVFARITAGFTILFFGSLLLNSYKNDNVIGIVISGGFIMTAIGMGIFTMPIEPAALTDEEMHMKRLAEAQALDDELKNGHSLASKDIHNGFMRWVNSDPQGGFVYIIHDFSVSGYYKIGRSREIKKRLTHFAVKLPFETRIVLLIPTSDEIALESVFHKLFADRRVRGEWFNLTGADISILKSMWLETVGRNHATDKNAIE